MKKVLVIGCGVSGLAVIEHCLQKGYDVSAVDQNIEKKVPCPLFGQEHQFTPFDFNVVVVSPGIKLTHPHVLKAKHLGVEVIGETEFALRLLDNKVIGITGTNGKSTVVSLVTHILNSSGKKAHAVGNIGLPIITLVDKIGNDDILVVEFSSFQLMTMKKKCLDIGVILNISPDHIDWHESLEAYKKAKFRIQSLIKPNGLFLYPIENLKAALVICKRLGVSEEDFEKGVSSFENLEHRMEYVTTVDGVICVNDSKATNIGSLEHALSGYKDSSVVLICGGRNKGVSMAPAAKLVDTKCRKVVLIGESKSLIAKELSEDTAKVFADTLEDAIQKGLQHAVRGDILLLAPGCSSLDMFENYMARGKKFKKILRKGHY